MTMLIEMNNVYKTYVLGEVKVPALHAISLEVEDNEYVAIMGPSGSGKSTLMNIMGCLDTPTSGSYNLGRKDVGGLNDNQLSDIRNTKIGFVFQTFNLLPRTTALHNVELPLIYSGMSSFKRKQLAMDVLERVGLSDRIMHKPNELSGGERQRVAIARALVNKPSLILADEPTGNLDSKTGEEIIEIMQSLCEQGNTIILVTHEEYIAKQTNRIIRLRDGIIEGDEN
ncbi:MAG: putative ABC transporter ATP-binding protein YknY [Candidatus Scalindua arabica]|uniref:ABC transporter ATP-binding protein YknY n=1 Tax=Candidatus Scalindua arabica TaxID=1127984 RepID=A0A941ZYP6_9BACT|nr:putative ABC transporter ATP-binding protein YknY [Candidatus Scalindua arabica]